MSKPVLVVKDPATGTSKIIEFPITEAQALQIATHRHYKGGLYLEMERVPYSEGGEVVGEFKSTMSLEELRDALRELEDSHVMLQTLRQCPLAENSQERDYDLH